MSNLLSTSRYSSRPTAKSGQGDSSKDILLADGPGDSISDLAWSPVSNYLAVSSWDAKVRIYDLNTKPSGTGKTFMDFDGPALGCCWSKVCTPLT